MAKVIMIQGTMSNVGKSIITAGLCRIFSQDGYIVKPFKSQNMALNSFVTPDGLEIGRAQAMQAEACGIEPTWAMNPVLLKPTQDASSQVIVNGRPIGNMTARQYFDFKESLIPDIKRAFGELARGSDVIVVEGAGSPAEINLRENDIVNMGLAEIIDAPVILVGDIDRGGVFAQLLGTYMLFSEEEKVRVKGLLINKFRGDKSLLAPGIEMIKDRLPIPFMGVVPYKKLDLEDEDSISHRFKNNDITHAKEIDIVCIRLPWISNFTDLDVFEQYAQVSVRYIDSVNDFGEPDMVVIPGSKNTLADLGWIKTSGLGDKIKAFAKTDKPVFGICGGFQILGREVTDPDGVESLGSEEGLGLLPVKTTIKGEKITRRFFGKIERGGKVFDGITGAGVDGYEIHMGHTEVVASEGVHILTEDGEGGLTGISKDNIYGTYIHGFFDEKGISFPIVSKLASAKGIEIDMSKVLSRRESKERAYDELADLLRENLNMEAMYGILREARVDD